MIGTAIKLIKILLEQPKDKIFVLKEYKKKRNLPQNAKYYKLLNELALKMRIGVEELHFEMLKRYSSRYEVLVPADYELRGIKYYEAQNTIKRGDKEFISYIVYVPSSELKENEFALLLEGLIEECKEQDIETRSPEEIARDCYE